MIAFPLSPVNLSNAEGLKKNDHRKVGFHVAKLNIKLQLEIALQFIKVIYKSLITVQLPEERAFENMNWFVFFLFFVSGASGGVRGNIERGRGRIEILFG